MKTAIRRTKTVRRTWLGVPKDLYEYRTGSKATCLRVSVLTEVDSGRMTAKVIEGDGRFTNFIVHVDTHETDQAGIAALVERLESGEWSGGRSDG